MKTVSLSQIAFMTFFVLWITACSGGSGDGLDENGQPEENADDNGVGAGDDNQPSGSDSEIEATFADIQSKVLSVNCATSGCHSGPSAPLGLDLAQGKAFDLLVNVPSVQQDQILRVSPGDPDNSYLVQKLEGTAVSGLQMPRNQPALPVETIQAIRDWIAQGALGPRLFSIQDNIFTPICTQCHLGESPAGGLNLEESNSFSNLVGVKRPTGSEIRVVAGDADSSFIIDKLEGNNLGDNRGSRMPLGGPFLEQSTVDVLRDWIDEGAEDN